MNNIFPLNCFYIGSLNWTLMERFLIDDRLNDEILNMVRILTFVKVLVLMSKEVYK